MSLSIKYCKLCGKPFNFKVTQYCNPCLKEIDRAFEKCRDYLDKNKYVTIKELAEKVEVNEKIILLLLKEERLSLEAPTDLTCEYCGAPIKSGRYCMDCTVRKHNEFNEIKAIYKKELTPNQQKMSGKEKMHIAQLKKQQDEKRRQK